LEPLARPGGSGSERGQEDAGAAEGHRRGSADVTEATWAWSGRLSLGFETTSFRRGRFGHMGAKDGEFHFGELLEMHDSEERDCADTG
jgi:hypothetical protein